MKAILVVDDNEPLARLYQHILDAEGYRALVATSRERALDLSSDEPLDLILLDCNMPGMSARDFVDELRGRHRRRVPIVGFSSLSRSSPTARQLESLVEGYVEKPDDIDRFLDIIRRYLN